MKKEANEFDTLCKKLVSGMNVPDLLGMFLGILLKYKLKNKGLSETDNILSEFLELTLPELCQLLDSLSVHISYEKHIKPLASKIHELNINDFTFVRSLSSKAMLALTLPKTPPFVPLIAGIEIGKFVLFTSTDTAILGLVSPLRHSKEHKESGQFLRICQVYDPAIEGTIH